MNDIKDFTEGVKYLAEQAAEKFPRDITQKGRIMANSGLFYTVIINGKTYTSIPSLNAVSFSVNDIVWITAPQGNFAQMFILGKTS